MLKVENVSKIYDGKRILNNLSFNVPEGEIYTLVGAIGEGKTTLLNMIAGFERIDEGNIYVKGTDCQLSSDKARKLFGFVPDVFPSYPTIFACVIHRIADGHVSEMFCLLYSNNPMITSNVSCGF